MENDTATLSGTLAHGAGTENVVYELVKERGEWKVSGIDGGRRRGRARGATPPRTTADQSRSSAVNKRARARRSTVKVDVRVTGFDLRPEGSVFRVNLVEDLETVGPDGRRIDELSRVGLQTFNQTTASATDASGYVQHRPDLQPAGARAATGPSSPSGT